MTDVDKLFQKKNVQHDCPKCGGGGVKGRLNNVKDKVGKDDGIEGEEGKDTLHNIKI